MTQEADKIKQWEWACRANKKTMVISWFVGTNPPEEIDYGSYDLAFVESDQSPQDTAPEELFKLTKKGGYIVIKSYLLPGFKEFGDRVTCLLDNPEGDFSLLQKV